MKISLFILVIGVACVFGYPYDSERWVYIPTADGHFHLVDQEMLKFQASLEPKADFAVKFYLFTRANPTSGREVVSGNSASLSSAGFSAGRQTRFVIHGWRNDATSAVGSVVRKAYLDRGDFNVFVVDWGAGASSLNYATARNNVPDAGAKVAAFIDFLNSNGQSSNNIYLVGHSLGAHVSGMAGKYAKSRPNTIFGLDAALPLFSVADASTRLATSDAGYVETIHTDGGRLGFDQPLGISSFYPAWAGVQPGCGLDMAGSCSHSRAYEYFGESVQSSNNRFLGKRCGGWSDIQKKSCAGSGTGLMGGEPSNPGVTGVYYVPVNSNYPFATGSV